MASLLKIAIIGAGPAGMTLAHLLLKSSIPVVIFEGEASASVRGQGGTLDLHDDTVSEILSTDFQVVKANSEIYLRVSER